MASLADRSAKILELPQTLRIDFHVGVAHISGKRLAKVASAMRSQSGAKDHVEVKTGSTGSLLSAAYTPATNSMSLKDERVPDTMAGKAAIVHESIHAHIDLAGLKVTAINDEVVAYLGEQIFWNANHRGVPNAKPLARKIYEEATKVIQSRTLFSRPGAKITWKDCDDLRAAIRAHPAYKSL